MRGFQTVRKWIDRSITGIEMRSGDYPVKNTRYIGIIIVLAGLKNVPRIEELHTLYDRCRDDEQATMTLPEVIHTEGDETPVPETGTVPASIEIPSVGAESSSTGKPGREPVTAASSSGTRRSSREKEPEDLSPEIKKPAPKKRGRRKKDDDFGLTWFR
jgi:hypothetical protein